jgi:hypothetical protein
MRALARDPARRYQSARHLRTELMAWLAETGLSHDKRHIAEYLRAIFGAKKQRAADEFAGDGDDDDELILEKALPKPDIELRVDPEDPSEDLHLVAPAAIPVANEIRSIHEASTAPIDTEATTGRVLRAELGDPDAAPLGEPPTLRLRADDTHKSVELPRSRRWRRRWWLWLWSFLRRK